MTIQRFLIQPQPVTALSPVRAYRVTDDTEDDSKSFLHLGHKSFDTPEALTRAIDSFKAEFPRGKVEVESGVNMIPYRAKHLASLFAHPATYVSSL